MEKERRDRILKDLEAIKGLVWDLIIHRELEIEGNKLMEILSYFRELTSKVELTHADIEDVCEDGICESCGNLIDPEWKVCNYCGNPTTKEKGDD